MEHKSKKGLAKNKENSVMKGRRRDNLKKRERECIRGLEQWLNDPSIMSSGYVWFGREGIRGAQYHNLNLGEEKTLCPGEACVTGLSYWTALDKRGGGGGG